MSTAPIRYRLILLIVIIASGTLSHFTLRAGHDWGGDFALYVHQAKGLVDGGLEQLLVRNRSSMLHSTAMTGPSLRIGPFLYPWGFPLLLSPVYALFGENIMAMKVYEILFLMLSLAVTFYLFVNELGPARALGIVVFFAFNPFMLDLVNTVGSDLPYHLLALLSLLFIRKLLLRRYWVTPAVTALLTGLLIGFAFLIRTNGIVLVGVLLFSQLIRYRSQLRSPIDFLRTNAQEALPYVSFALGVLIASALLPDGSGSHLDFLARLTPGKLAYNVMYYFALPSDFYTGALFPQILYGLTLPFLLLGLHHRAETDYPYILYVVLSLAVFIVWPPVQGLRFVTSLIPFYLYFVFFGLSRAEQLYRKAITLAARPDRWLVSGFCGLVLVQFLFSASANAIANTRSPEPVDGPYTETSRAVFDYVNQQTSEEAVIVFFKPRVMDLMTRHLSLRVFSYQEILKEKGDYLVYKKGQAFGQITPDEVEQLQKSLPAVLENNDFIIVDLRTLREDRFGQVEPAL